MLFNMFSYQCKYVLKILIVCVKITYNNDSVFYVRYFKLLFFVRNSVVVNFIAMSNKRLKSRK